MTLADVVLLWTAATTSVALAAFARPRPRARARVVTPSVLVLRPCAGVEPGLATALASSASAPERARIRMLVAADTDPAHPIALEAAGAMARDVAVMVTDARGPNAKAAQLARAVRDAREDVILVCDSDVVMTLSLVDTLLGAVADGADVAWAPPIEIAPRTAADRTSARVLDASLHSFPLLSALDPAGMVGKAFAVRRDALAAIGGFEALVDRLGEDMELAHRLRAARRSVRAVTVVAASLAGGRTWAQTLDRYNRWLLVIRAQRPALLLSYPLLLAAAPLQAALALAALTVDARGGLFALDAVLFSRALVAAFARVRAGTSLRGILLAPWSADVLLLFAFARAITRRCFTWRGRVLRIAAGGRLAEGEP